MRNSGASLHGFLPPHAYVMGTKAPPALTDGGLCSFCGSSAHAELRQNGDSPFLFVTERIPEGSSESVLFPKILEAMKLQTGAVRWWALSSRASDLPVECVSAALSACWSEAPGVLVVLGAHLGEALLPEEAPNLRGQVHERMGWKIVITEALAEMASQPEKKKIAWEELKRALQVAKQERVR